MASHNEDPNGITNWDLNDVTQLAFELESHTVV